MSTINKKPFISKVLESLTSEQLTALRGLVNGSTGPTFKSLINATYKITGSDKGVKHIILETANRTLSGYLLYNNSYCVLVSYALNSQELAIFKINLTDSELEPVDEYLDIDELRTLVEDENLDNKVEALSSVGLKREVVESLPTGSDIQTNVIYLVATPDAEAPNIYNEYMYINNGWELLGTTATSGGDSIDSDVTVEIESSYTSFDYNNRTNYAQPITIQKFIKNCEDGAYTNTGTIAKITNLLSNQTYRIILIGVNEDKLLNVNENQYAKTTWQFLDSPLRCYLGLPYNMLSLSDSDPLTTLQQIIDKENTGAVTPMRSSVGGYSTAQELLICTKSIEDSLPISLKRAIKIVHKSYNVPYLSISIAANGASISNTAGATYMSLRLFNLSRNEIFGNGTNENNQYSYFSSNFGNSPRIRYFQGTANMWWTSTPGTSSSWYRVKGNGEAHLSSNSVNDLSLVVPAFCI